MSKISSDILPSESDGTIAIIAFRQFRASDITVYIMHIANTYLRPWSHPPSYVRTYIAWNGQSLGDTHVSGDHPSLPMRVLKTEGHTIKHEVIPSLHV